MNVTIDGEPHELGLAQEATFPDIMTAIGKLDASTSIGITSVKLDGKDITGADWSHLSSVAAASINRLEIETGDVSKLARDLLDSLEDFAGRLIGELGRTAEDFRIGDRMKGGEQLARAIDGIQLLSHTLEMVIRNIGIDVAAIMFNNKPSNEYLGKMVPVLDDMFAVQQRDDLVLMADLIEYELIPQFEDLQKIIKLWREVYATRS